MHLSGKIFSYKEKKVVPKEGSTSGKEPLKVVIVFVWCRIVEVPSSPRDQKWFKPALPNRSPFLFLSVQAARNIQTALFSPGITRLEILTKGTGLLEYFDQEYLGNGLKVWCIAFGIAVLSMVAVKLLKAILIRSIRKFATKSSTGIDELFVEILGKTRFLLVFVISLYAGASVLVIPAPVERISEIIVILAALLQIGFWGNAILTFWINKVVQRKMQSDAAGATTMTALGFLGRVIWWSILLLVALDNIGVNITGLAAGVGIGGIAIALAVQSILSDLFASLSIVLDKPFVIGDFIIVDNYLGTVEHIGLKTTRIRSLSGEQLIFSNTDLLNSRIRNYKRMFERRVVFEVGITYQTPLEKVKAVSGMIRAIIETQSQARFDRAHFKQFGDSALVYEAVYYVKSAEYNDYMDTQERINLAIMKQFVEQGIEFAYPTRTLFVQSDSKNDIQPTAPTQ